MTVAISASSPGLDAPIDPRFGRCQYFIIIDSTTFDFEMCPNRSKDAMSGARARSAWTTNESNSYNNSSIDIIYASNTQAVQKRKNSEPQSTGPSNPATVASTLKAS